MLHQSFRKAAKNCRRRAKAYGVPSTLTAYQFRRIVRCYGRRCLACGASQSQETPLTVDHVVPLCKGGPNVAENTQPLCQVCNQTKSGEVIDYRPDRGAVVPVMLARTRAELAARAAQAESAVMYA